eukprot:scaffold137349_cov40-Prasinocladus_malaysianus.AAC.1
MLGFQIAEQAELAKMEERKRAALAQKDAQMAQLEETRRKLLEDRYPYICRPSRSTDMQQRMVEGQMLLEAAEREKQKDIANQMKMRGEAQQRRLDTLRANDAIKEYRRVQEERERMADEQIAGSALYNDRSKKRRTTSCLAYAAQKAAIIEERKRREMERQAEKDRKRNEMIAYMEANLEK